MLRWYYTREGRQFGPVTAERIRELESAGTIDRLTLVWYPGMSDWTALGDLPVELLPTTATGTDDIGRPEVEHQFEFRGKEGEFFRIWIVNVALTVLTFGIYAAWAKVRTKRYFFGNTLVDGKPFDFTGRAVAILKGNLVFGGLFVLYVVTSALKPALAIAVVVVIFILSPWLIYKALRFRAHNTVHRNVRFRFRGTLGDAYAAFFWLPLVVPFTLGLALPYVQFSQRKYYLGNMGWGDCLARMGGEMEFFYKTFFKALGLLVLLFIPFAIVVAALTPALAETNPDLLVYVVFLLYVPMLVPFLYYAVRVANYSINSTAWGALGRLESTVGVRDMIGLYVSNALAILVSLGLLVPWAKIRMARYRASKTKLVVTGDLGTVTQSGGTGDSAMGDAGADIFDFDIGF